MTSVSPLAARCSCSANIPFRPAPPKRPWALRKTPPWSFRPHLPRRPRSRPWPIRPAESPSLIGRQQGAHLGDAVAMDQEGEDFQFDIGAMQKKGAPVSVSPCHFPGVLGQKPVFAADAGAADQVNGVIVAGRAVEKAQVAGGLGDLSGRYVEVGNETVTPGDVVARLRGIEVDGGGKPGGESAFEGVVKDGQRDIKEVSVVPPVVGN